MSDTPNQDAPGMNPQSTESAPAKEPKPFRHPARFGIIIAISALLGILFNPKPRVDTRPTPENLAKWAAQASRGLPLMMDEEVEAFRVSSGPNLIIYSFRLVAVSIEDVDVNEIRQRVEAEVPPKVCSKKETRDGFLVKGVSLRYDYFDKKETLLTSLTVTPESCGIAVEGSDA